MYKLTQGNTHQLPDVDAFVAQLNQLATDPNPTLRNFFAPGAELTLARAPGRLHRQGRRRGGRPRLGCPREASAGS